jgi:hypothetical protein
MLRAMEEQWTANLGNRHTFVGHWTDGGRTLIVASAR